MCIKVTVLKITVKNRAVFRVKFLTYFEFLFAEK